MALSAADAGDLEIQRGRWWATLSSGDVGGFVELFGEDAVWVTSEVEEIEGREAIRAYWEPVLAQCDYEFTITAASVRVAGDLAIERARFTSALTPKAEDDERAEPLRHDGRYLMFWRRDPVAGWRVTRYADISSEP